ncbi:agmatinase [Parvularcula sp. ZS-1/3]|uniref:Agmatinase n=1 Tax=Parvularcula mediterranea TaxID=2732508 RepID=A0A7Y3RMD2_9PROT|nr:agmatinase [Parvularcula mediterranea]NNU16739.1 agmatinase [Parvularcula mediterranea]
MTNLMFEHDRIAAPEDAPRVHIIPFGLEDTVSYEGGTAKAPEAIFRAAKEVELWDDELWREPIRSFNEEIIETGPIAKTIEEGMGQLEALVRKTLEAGAFPMTLGGEHSITPGAIKPLVEKHDGLHLLQFDAHADLRDMFRGDYYSHANAMRRCLDDERVNLTSFGIRNISRTEVPFYEENRHRIDIHWAREKAKWDIEKALEPLRGKKVYVTFDVDGFDSSLMPATGTPEPGGMFWDDVMPILRHTAEIADIVGADVVELAPRPELHGCDFLAAKLCYKILAYKFAL